MLRAFAFSIAVLLPVQQVKADGPQITFTKELHEFGIIDKGDQATTAFAFTNTGNAQLEISEVKTSCGCTSAKLSKLSYQPGESGEIPISFDSTRFDGVIQKTITVVTNDAENPRKQLRITGTVQAEVNINPAHFTVYDVKRSEDFEGEVQVFTGKLPRLEISDIQSNIPFLKLSPQRVDDRSLSLKLSFAGKDLPANSDSVRGVIGFKTNSEKLPQVQANIYIKIAEAVTVQPRSVNFFASQPGKSRQMTVSLKPSDAQKMKILKVESSLDFIEVSPNADQGTVQVTLTDKAAQGNFSGTITVETDLAEQPKIQIPVRGSIL